MKNKKIFSTEEKISYYQSELQYYVGLTSSLEKVLKDTYDKMNFIDKRLVVLIRELSEENQERFFDKLDEIRASRKSS